jgi:hypothetical protein
MGYVKSQRTNKRTGLIPVLLFCLQGTRFEQRQRCNLGRVPASVTALCY